MCKIVERVLDSVKHVFAGFSMFILHWVGVVSPIYNDIFFFIFFSRCEKCFRNMVFITTCQNNAEESCFQVMGGYNYGWGGYSSVGGVGGVYMILATYLLYDIYHTLWWVWSCLTFHTFPKCSYITILYIYPGVWPDLTDLPRGCDRI